MNGRPVARIATAPTTVIQYYVNDHLGTPLALTDQQKGIQWRAKSYPFGEVYSEVTSSMNDLRFPGQRIDRETSLNYNWHRYYNAKTGRYTQPDPLGEGLTPQIYAYAKNNPIMYTDPAGLWCIKAPGTFESMVPFWGPFRQGLHEWSTGNELWAIANFALAGTDLSGIGAAFRGVASGEMKLLLRTKGFSWGRTRKAYLKLGLTTPWEPIHHVIIPRGRWGKSIPNFIKNQPWNLKPLTRAEHDIVTYARHESWITRLKLGTPSWYWTTLSSTAGHLLLPNNEDDNCECQ